MIKKIKNKISFSIFASIMLASCASHVEDRASIDFEPIIPENMNLANQNSNSGVYIMSQVEAYLLLIEEQVKLVIF